MKLRYLKIGLPIVFGLGTLATTTLIISSCSKTTFLDKINPIPTQTKDYQQFFSDLTTSEFTSKFTSQEQTASVLEKLGYNPALFQYVKDTLVIEGTNVDFCVANSQEKKIYKVSLFNFKNKNQQTTTIFNVGKNKIIPSNINQNHYSNIGDFEFSTPKSVNLSNLKTLQNQDISINKKDALTVPIITQKINEYKTNLQSNILKDIDGGLKIHILDSFNKSNIFMSPENLFYYKDVHVNDSTNKIEGNIYLQIKNNSSNNMIINLFNKSNTIPPSQYLTIGLEFNSDIEPNIFNIGNKNFLGLDISHTTIRTSISNNDVEQSEDKVSIARSNILNTEVLGVSLTNNLFNQQEFLSQEIGKLNKEYFVNSLKEAANSDFQQLKSSIVNGISILEVLANEDITLENALKSIGANLAKILEMAKVDNNIINVIKNLLNPQSTSDFLYNSFDSIIAILNQSGANIPGTTMSYIKVFLLDNLGSKSKEDFNYFITNLNNLKETIKKFVLGIEGLEPSSVSTILSLVDSASKNENIITFLANNINIIINLLKTLLPKEQTIVISTLKAISQIQVDNKQGNLLKDRFWNLVTNTNTNAKVILTNLLTEISNILPTSSDPNNNIIKNSLIYLKNLLESTSIINNFNPTNIVDVLNTLLNRKRDGSPMVDGGETTKQYFENNFVIELSTQDNLTYDNTQQILNGRFSYTYKFTKELRWDMTKFKEVFYDDGFKLFSSYAKWWYTQASPSTTSDPNFLFAISLLGKTIGTLLAQYESSLNILDGFNWLWGDSKNLKNALLGLIDASTKEMTEEQRQAKYKASFKLLFEIDFTGMPGLVSTPIEALLKIPIKNLLQLSMVINTDENIRKTYERYWNFIFGKTNSFVLQANSAFTTTNTYTNSRVYPNIGSDGSVTWKTPFNWVRDLNGIDSIFQQNALSQVLLSFLNPDKVIQSLNNDSIYSKPITEMKLNGYSNDIASLNYKLVLNTKNIESTNKLFNVLKQSYNNSQITPEIQEALNEVFNVVMPSNLNLFKPTYLITPDRKNNPTKYTIQLFFPTNILMVDKENENLTNKTVQFSSFYKFELQKSS